MGRLDELFGTRRAPEGGGSDLERLEGIEEAASSGEFPVAINLLDHIEKEENVFLGVQIVLKSLMDYFEELTPREISGYLGELIPIINGISSWRYRALLLGKVAVLYYRIEDDFNGDIALKSSINLAYAAGEDVLIEILEELIKLGILEKAAHAFSLVKDRKKVDYLLGKVAEYFYLRGDEEKALKALNYIGDPFHRAVAFYRLALIEAERDRERALGFIERAIENARQIENRYAKIELLMKLSDVRAKLTGEGISLGQILKESFGELPKDHGNANEEDQNREYLQPSNPHQEN
ncbi:hypothetical protein [Thermococcus sp.]